MASAPAHSFPGTSSTKINKPEHLQQSTTDSVFPRMSTQQSQQTHKPANDPNGKRAKKRGMNNLQMIGIEDGEGYKTKRAKWNLPKVAHELTTLASTSHKLRKPCPKRPLNTVLGKSQRYLAEHAPSDDDLGVACEIAYRLVFWMLRSNGSPSTEDLREAAISIGEEIILDVGGFSLRSAIERDEGHTRWYLEYVRYVKEDLETHFNNVAAEIVVNAYNIAGIDDDKCRVQQICSLLLGGTWHSYEGHHYLHPVIVQHLEACLFSNWRKFSESSCHSLEVISEGSILLSATALYCALRNLLPLLPDGLPHSQDMYTLLKRGWCAMPLEMQDIVQDFAKSEVLKIRVDHDPLNVLSLPFIVGPNYTTDQVKDFLRVHSQSPNLSGLPKSRSSSDDSAEISASKSGTNTSSDLPSTTCVDTTRSRMVKRATSCPAFSNASSAQRNTTNETKNGTSKTEGVPKDKEGNSIKGLGGKVI